VVWTVQNDWAVGKSTNQNGNQDRVLKETEREFFVWIAFAVLRWRISVGRWRNLLAKY